MSEHWHAYAVKWRVNGQEVFFREGLTIRTDPDQGLPEARARALNERYKDCGARVVLAKVTIEEVEVSRE